MAPDLTRQLHSSDTISVIIQYKTAPSAGELKTLTSLGAGSLVSLHSINAVQTSLPASAFPTLREDANVLYISPDRALASHAGPGKYSSIAQGPEYTTDPINAPAVWKQGLVGTGVGVAVIDSGVSTERDLAAPTAATVLMAGIPGLANFTITPGLPGITGPQGRIVYNACFTTNCAFVLRATSKNDHSMSVFLVTFSTKVFLNKANN